MSTWTRKNRRWQDRAPLTARIGWAFWRSVNRVERVAVTIIGLCAVAVFWALLIYCALSVQP